MVATVIRADIPLVAQCVPGDRLMFRDTSLEEARESLRRLMDEVAVVIKGRATVG